MHLIQEMQKDIAELKSKATLTDLAGPISIPSTEQQTQTSLNGLLNAVKAKQYPVFFGPNASTAKTPTNS